MTFNMGTTYPAAPLVPPVDWGAFTGHDHSVQFYEDDGFLLDDLSSFIGAALGAGDAGLVIATPAHREGLAARLQARGLDLTRAAGQGRYVALDAAATLAQFMRDGQPDAARFAEVVGEAVTQAATATQGARPHVAAFGEMVALLWAAGQADAALALEQLWNDLAQTHAFDLRCAYPMTFFAQAGDGGPLAQICALHRQVIPAESYTALAADADRGRAIAHLQQKARALETEIATRRQAEQTLRDRNEELRRAVAARDEFLSIAAHELKTPLTSLRGFAQLLLRDARRGRQSAPERLVPALTAIESQTGKLSQLVARLLDTAQIEAGKLRIAPERADLVALVQGTLADHQDGDHAFIFAGPAQLAAVVDPVRFEQVITNLLDNAVKFSPQGGAVTVALGQDENGGIRLSVADQGAGIPPDQREAIFDRFHQAHSAHHLSGMGLGLYITREIVALHGGRVWIEQPADGGSCFVVTLPPEPGA